MDIMNPILSGLEEQGYALEERASASRHSLYDLAGKKGAWISSKEADNGAVMRTDIILGDLIQPTGSSNYMDQGPDTNLFRISVLNSHNSKYAVKVNTSYCRIICMNGMTQPHFSAGVYGKHTSNFSVDGLQNQINNAMGMMGDDAERFGLYARTPCTVEQAERFLKLTVARLHNKPNGDANFSETMVNNILTQFNREDNTFWGLYNAVTYWQTHTKIKAGSNNITSIVGREQKVAAMLRSKHMDEVFAI